ncbi:hypothetical protein ES703_56161 [subsurface metagenome]
MSLEEAKKILCKWASENKLVRKVYVYGSQVKGDFKASSDLDVAIEIDPEEGDTNALSTWICEGSNWKEKLKTLLPRHKVHLEWYDENETPTVRAGIEKSGVLAYSRHDEKKCKELRNE